MADCIYVDGRAPNKNQVQTHQRIFETMGTSSHQLRINNSKSFNFIIETNILIHGYRALSSLNSIFKPINVMTLDLADVCDIEPGLALR